MDAHRRGGGFKRVVNQDTKRARICLILNPMEPQLDPAEARVLGALMEKEIATPDYYPLSLNALVNACNQKSNRDPVVEFDDMTVEAALESLRAKGMALRISGESRVPKHAQRFTEKLNLGRREAALICVLLLRGPQTPGELRGRAERLYQFDDLEAVENTLGHLAEGGLVRKLARQSGSREARWAQLLCGESEVGESAMEPPQATSSGRALADKLAAMEEELAQLRREFDDFRRRFE